MRDCEAIIDKRDEAWESGNLVHALLLHVTLYDAVSECEKEQVISDLTWALTEILEADIDGDGYAQVIVSIFSCNEYPPIFNAAPSEEFIALIISMFVESMKLSGDEQTYERLRGKLIQTVECFDKDSNEYKAIIIYAIANIFQHTEPEYAIRLYEEFPEINKNFPDELTLSDLYFFVGGWYNDYPEKRSEALLLMEAGYEIRVRITGEHSIFSQMQKLFILENHILSGEYETAAKYAEQLSSVEDDDDSRATIRCYASLLMANIGISYSLKKIDAEKYLLQALSEFEGISKDESMHDHLHFTLHSQWALFYGIVGNDNKEEYHARLAYTHVKAQNIRSFNTIIAQNNLALALSKIGKVTDAKELLKDTLNLIRDLSAEESEAAAYVYNTIGIIYDADYFGESPHYYFERAFRNIHSNRPDVLLFRLNSICAILSDASNQQLHRAEADINEITESIEAQEYANQNLSTILEKAKISLLMAQKKPEEARQALMRYFNAISQDADEMVLHDAFLNLYSIAIQILNKEELETLVLGLAHSFKRRVECILLKYDEYYMLQAMEKINTILNMVLSLTYNGKINLPVETLYEIIANYKCAYTDMLKLKKKMRSLNPIKESCYRQIALLNTELIDVELNHLYRNESLDCEETRQKKRLMELEVSNDAVLPTVEWKSFEELLSSIPANTTFVDYYLFSGDLSLELLLGNATYANFVIYRDSEERLKIKMLSYIGGYETRHEMFYLWASMVAKKNIHLTPPVTAISRYALHSKLFKPLQKYVGNTTQYIYVSPDFDLARIPFQVLGGKPNEYMGEEYTFIYVESIRDIGSPRYIKTTGIKALIAGNAKFSINDIDADDIPTPMKDLQVAPLPLSKIEATSVADKIGTQPLQRERATKYMLQNSDADIIHIATHGYFKTLPNDEEFKVNPLKRSSLFFSGVNDWVHTGKADDAFGNGILTAEEICNTDMKPPSLVVLSACLSALGETNLGNGIIGLRTSFKVNGAGTLLINIWEVDDFASAVIMDKFYDNLNAMPAADALRQAQLYLKEVTIKDLRSGMWFDESKLRKVGWAADDVKEFSRQNDFVKPFQSVRYWGGYMIIE